jgi:hypothetical protein
LTAISVVFLVLVLIAAASEPPLPIEDDEL